MIAAPRSPFATSGDASEDAAPLVERPDDCGALIAALADGRPHATIDLARQVLGRADAAGEASIVAAVAALRDLGMAVVRTDGSVRARAFDPLDASTLRRALPAWDVSVVGSTRSTSDALLGRVRTQRGATPPMLLATDVQVAGRGRLGRRWTSAPGASLAVSYAVRVVRPVGALDGVTLVCGLAVRDAVLESGVVAGLKWPNDLVVGDRKLAGILVESQACDGATALVVGVGLNVTNVDAAAPDGLGPIDLAACGAGDVDRHRMIASIARSLQSRLATFEADGFGPFVEEWNAVDAFRDRPVTLRSTAGAGVGHARSGVDRGVDARGALRLEVDGRVEPVISGDLSLRLAVDR